MYLTSNSGCFNVLNEKKAAPMRMEFDKLSREDSQEFNELNILSRRYIRLTYNKYDLAPGIREFLLASGRKIRR